MQILFIYSIQKSIRQKFPLKGNEDIQMGISIISSVLKESGHSTNVLVLDRKYKNKNYKLIDKTISEYNPGLICFTAVNTEIDFIESVASFIKESFPKCHLLLGGVHVTLNPDENYFETFDSLCIGEGEFPVLELVNLLEEKEEINSIKNLWIKEDGQIYKNDTRPFIGNLDELPFADRKMWQSWILNKNTRHVILLGRGCPFNCSYCCNHKLRKVAEGKYVRLRSVENIIEELTKLTTIFPSTNEIFFEIETLGTDQNWLEKLCVSLERFNKSRDSKISFSSNLRINPGMDLEKVFSLLQKANFNSVTIGLESGNERVRKEVLNRNYSNELIMKAASLAKEHNIKLGLFNLIGLPTETYEDFLDTLHINQTIQPDWHATSIFFPYKGTMLYDMVKEMGILPEKIDSKHERQKAVIDYPDFPRKLIQKSFDRFHYEVYKKASQRSIVKLTLYYFQTIVGHDFMANAKIRIINILSRICIKKSNLFLIFQKS